MSSRHTQAGSTPIWILIWLVGMAAIAYWCVVRHLPALQEQLQRNAQAALTDVSAPDVNVNVKGRTAFLTGAVTTVAQKDTLLSALGNASGIRGVDDDISVVEVAIATNDQNAPIVDSVTAETEAQPTEAESESPAPTDADDVPAEAEAEGDDLQAAAVEPEDTAAQDAATAETTEQAPSEQNDDQTPPTQSNETDAGDSDAVLEQSESQTQSKTELSETNQLAQDVDAKARALIEQAKNKRLQKQPAEPVSENRDEKTSAATGRPASFKMRVNDNTLTLTGDLSNEDNLLSFVRTAMTTFDASYVVNSVQVHDDVAPAPWLNSLTKFVADMKPLSNAGIDLIESQISLSGTADSEQVHDAVINQALTKLPGLSLVERINIGDTAAAKESKTSESSTAPATTEPDDSDAEVTVVEPSVKTELKAEFDTLESTTILFESGSNVLTTTSLRTVESIAALFAEYPDTQIDIDGHTDSSGILANNLELSQLRANAVRDYLIKLGISANRLSAYGFGDGVPIADNSTAAGRKMNRRIEFNF